MIHEHVLFFFHNFAFFMEGGGGGLGCGGGGYNFVASVYTRASIFADFELI